MGYRVGIDIGGTFTDFTVLDDVGHVTIWKEDSTPDDPLRAIETGLNAIASQKGHSLDEFLVHTDSLVHGSTIATNALIERDSPPIGLLCTKGFRDIIYFRDGYKPDRFNVHLQRPLDFVDRYLRLEVEGRIKPDSSEHTPLNEADIIDAAGKMRQAGVQAVAIAFLWSVVNPEHERRAAEIISEQLPEIPVLCSSRVLPEIREWERTSATVLSAYILPRIGDYLRRFEEMLQSGGMTRQLQVMQINGGCASVSEIMERPVYTLASGPAAAPATAMYHAKEVDMDNVITADMGGTSFDVCVIKDGRPAMSRSVQVEFQPIGVSAVEVHSIGAGGGSIAWIDDGGALRVGPQSAGATPGPACYGQGGTEPTVTDANVVLGYLDPEAFLGGRRRLRDDLSRKAVEEHVASKLGLNHLEAAAGVIEIVDTNMVAGIRAVSIERGIDPRNFTLIVGGGAGGLHAVRLARKLEIGKVLIPREASIFCSFGMTVTDTRHDYVWSYHADDSNLDLDRLNRAYRETEEEARNRLHHEGFPDSHIDLERFVDVRYVNQVHEITVPVPSGVELGPEQRDQIVETFHKDHEQRYTYSIPDAPVEFLHWRLSAVGRANELALAYDRASVNGDGSPRPKAEREAYSMQARKMETMPVYETETLAVGAEIVGPAILEASTTTTVIGEGDKLSVIPGNRLLIEVNLEK